MRTAAETSMMTWGLLTVPSPANSSTAMTLSSENRATDCAAAGAPQARTQTTTAENAEHAGHKNSRRSPRASRLTARGESLASHRDGRGAPMARRDDGEYREYLSEEQRSQAGVPNAAAALGWSGDASPVEC